MTASYHTINLRSRHPSFTVTTSSVLEAQFTNVAFCAKPGITCCSPVVYSVSVDGGPLISLGTITGSGTGPLVDLGPVSSGSHTLQLTAQGVVGGCNFGTLVGWGGSLVVTTNSQTPPTHTTIKSATDGNDAAVQNGSLTVSTSITFEVAATPGTNPIAKFECSLDGSSFSNCASTNPGRVTYNNLVAGQPHTVTIRAVDTQENKDPSHATFRWTIVTPTQAIQNLISTIDSTYVN